MEYSKLMTALSEKGYFHLTAQSSEQVVALTKKLGNVFYTTDVKIKSDSRALVTSAKAIDFHTDHHRAQWVLWHCLEQTDIGGESILMDATQAYKMLSDADKKILSQVMLLEHKIFGEGMDLCPLVQENNGILKFYYSFWLVDKNMSQEKKRSVMAFRNSITAQNIITIKLERSDVLIVDNHRILHGRRKIEGHQKRFLKRFWIE